MQTDYLKTLLVTALSLCSLLALPAKAQGEPKLQKLSPEYVSENGCPIEVDRPRSELEVDASGTPLAARHYIDYKNIGEKPIAGVKFRIGYVDDHNSIRDTLEAEDSHAVAPAATASQRWRGEVDPLTRGVKIRTLWVKFNDGTLWQSAKNSGSAPGPNGTGSASNTARKSNAKPEPDVPPPPPVPEDVFPVL